MKGGRGRHRPFSLGRFRITIERLIVAALTFAVLSVIACRRPSPPPPPDLAARLGDTPVRYAEFGTYLTRTVGDSEGALGSDVLSQLFDQFLEERLLVRLATDRGLAPAGGPRAAIDALLAEGQKEPPTDEEVAAYYQAHQKDFARPERVRLRQILTESRSEAERARKEVAGGRDFAEVAKRLSRDPSAGRGGSQGELGRADLPPSFVDVIFALKPGEVSRVVPADYGFHLFEVQAHLPSEVETLDKARPEIVEKLRQERADGLLRELVKEARSRYNVEVYQRNLPFNYEGADSDAKRTKP
jgi:PPIC-type PPIASE domain